jgi:hypothetical protein
MWSRIVGDFLWIENEIWIVNLKRKWAMLERNPPSIRLTDIQ